jgi:hypothetical protein
MEGQAKRMITARTDIAFGKNGSHPEMNVSGRNCPSAMIALTHELIPRRTLMNKLLITTTSLAALGVIFAAGTNVATAAEKQKSASRYECFTDDGYGRKLPCSYGYKLQKRADGNYDCFTDDGYGRKLTCSYGIKRR